MLNYLIACVDKDYGIGKKNAGIPWDIKKDMKFFSSITKNTKQKNKFNCIIMGKKTYKTINKVLPNRYNIVLTNNDYLHVSYLDIDKINYTDFNSIGDLIKDRNDIENVFVIGGSEIYSLFLNKNLVDKIYLNQINKSYDCDIFFPFNKLQDNNFVIVDHEKTDIDDIELTFNILNKENIHSSDYQYIKILKDILYTGERRLTRNAYTYSLFDKKLKFDVSESFPLLTTKKMFIRGIIEELLFFIRGDTDSTKLSDKGVKIWEGNTTREFLNKRGLTDYKVGDMGAIYGWIWRYFGADYKGCSYDYSNKGFDQLKDVINKILNDPYSRRIMMTTFDPSKVSESVLAPCHSLILQFYISNENDLSVKMYQRSADAFLGLPFNIASTSLMLYLIAHITNKNPKYVIIDLGDTHIYEEHLEQTNRQIKRLAYKFPRLEITKKFNKEYIDNIDERIKFLENLTYDDFKLYNYKHHKGILAPMIP